MVQTVEKVKLNTSPFNFKPRRLQLNLAAARVHYAYFRAGDGGEGKWCHRPLWFRQRSSDCDLPGLAYCTDGIAYRVASEEVFFAMLELIP